MVNSDSVATMDGIPASTHSMSWSALLQDEMDELGTQTYKITTSEVPQIAFVQAPQHHSGEEMPFPPTTAQQHSGPTNNALSLPIPAAHVIPDDAHTTTSLWTGHVRNDATIPKQCIACRVQRLRCVPTAAVHPIQPHAVVSCRSFVSPIDGAAISSQQLPRIHTTTDSSGKLSPGVSNE